MALVEEVAFGVKCLFKFHESRPWQPETVDELLVTANAVLLHGLVELVFLEESPIRALAIVRGVFARGVRWSPSFPPRFLGWSRAFVLRFRSGVVERIEAEISSEEVERHVVGRHVNQA